MHKFFPDIKSKMKEVFYEVYKIDVSNFPNMQDIDRFIDVIFYEFSDRVMTNSKIIKLRDDTKLAYQEHLDSTSVFISEENEFPGLKRIIFAPINLFLQNANDNGFYIFSIHNDGSFHAEKLIPKNENTKQVKDIQHILKFFFNKDENWIIENCRCPFFIPTTKNGEFYKALTFEDKKIYKAIRLIITLINNAKMNHIQKIIFNSLNQDIIDLSKTSDKEDDLNFIQWITGGDGVSPDIALLRQQAIRAYPVFAHDIWKDKKMCDIVETKKPLTPALAELKEVSEKVVKRVQGKTANDLGLDIYFHVKHIFELEERNFQQLKSNIPDLNILRDYATGIYDMNINKFLDYLSLKSGHPLQHIERIKQNSIWDIRDGFEFLRTRFFLPVFLNKLKNHAEENNLIINKKANNVLESNLFTISKKILLEYTNLKTILDFSERYHRNLLRWEDMFTSDSGMKNISWQPMFDRIDLGDGWEARELHSVEALKEQGRQENHCVGGYVESILKRKDQTGKLIFSLEKDGEIKSTIDMICSKNEEKNGLDVKMQQNRAHSNKNPCSETLNISTHLINKIKSEPVSRLNTYLHHLGNTRKEYQKHQSENHYLSICGYNPWDREILENVWDEFKPIFPKKLRRGGLDEFIEMMPIEDIAFQPRKQNDELNSWDIIRNKELNQVNHIEENAEMVL